MSEPTRAIVILARAPSAPGKTRLTEGLTVTAARALRQALLLDTLDVARALNIPVIVSFTPFEAHDEMAQLAPDVQLVPQAEGDLGLRMHHALVNAASAARDVVLIGSDLPNLPVWHLHDAFYALERGTDLVFGPAGDGGYYLVGARSRCLADAPSADRVARVFDGIAWSSPTVLTTCLVQAHRAGLTTDTVSAWRDIDTRADLDALLRTQSPAAPRVRAWAQLFVDGRIDGTRTDGGRL